MSLKNCILWAKNRKSESDKYMFRRVKNMNELAMQSDSQKHRQKIKKYSDLKTHILLGPSKGSQGTNFSKAVQSHFFT